MDLVWLEDFLAIAEEGGFSRAAERRNVTQPALSRRIRSLEEWLGTPLFERSTHTLKLTPAGETFRPVAEDVLRRVQLGREEALEVTRLKAETVHFAATHALSQMFFPDWIRRTESARAGAAVQLVAVNFAGDEVLGLAAKSYARGRVEFLGVPAAAERRVRRGKVSPPGDPTVYAVELDAGEGRGWTSAGDEPNPLEGCDVTALRFSHGEPTREAVMLVEVLVN